MSFNIDWLILCALAVNVIGALAYVVVIWTRTRAAYVFQRGMIMVLCPLVGPLCFLVSYLLSLVLSRKDVDYENLSYDKTRKQFLQPVNRELELETLPLEEVLSMSVARDRRRAMLNMLKLDVRENLALVRKAAENQDPETSHYAASALTDALGQFSSELNSLQAVYDRDRRSLQANRELLDAVLRILESGGLLKVEESKYQYMLTGLIQNLDRNHPEELTPRYCFAMVRALRATGRPGEAEEWAGRSLERFPEAEESYLGMMYIQYNLGKGQEFEEALKKLTGSSAVLSEKGLRIVRFWLAK